jgi:hypothetical protein
MTSGVFIPRSTDLAIGRCAELFIAHYGTDAASMAEERASDLRALGAITASERWIKIKAEIDRLAMLA